MMILILHQVFSSQQVAGEIMLKETITVCLVGEKKIQVVFSQLQQLQQQLLILDFKQVLLYQMDFLGVKILKMMILQWVRGEILSLTVFLTMK